MYKKTTQQAGGAGTDGGTCGGEGHGKGPGQQQKKPEDDVVDAEFEETK